MRSISHPVCGLVFLGILTVAGIRQAGAQGSDRSGDVVALGDCRGCTLDGQDFSDRRLIGVDLGVAKLSGIDLDRAAMGLAIFDEAYLKDVSFDGADLKGASFVGARLENVSFVGAELRGAVFAGAILDRTDLQQGLLCTTQMPGDEMDSSDCNTR